MSAERKKLLWISISACVFGLIVLAAGFFLLAPKKGGALAPATIANNAPPKAQDPQDFLSTPPPPPATDQPHNQDGGVIIVYGDKPSIPPAGAAGSTPAGAAQPGSAGAAAPGVAELPVPSVPPAAKSLSPARPASQKPSAVKAQPKAQGANRPAAKTTSLKVEEYWIQASSFTSRGRADELKQGLAEKGIAALISVKDIAGKSWYRVRVGPYSAKAEADGWLGRLKEVPGCAEAYVSKTAASRPKP